MSGCSAPRSVRGIVFDMDGTLLDTVGLVSRAWEFALRSLGYRASSSDIEPLVGLPASRIAEAFTGSSSSLVELSNLRAEYLEEHAREVRAFPEVPGVLSELRSRGLRMAVATSIPSRMARLFLETAGILGLMDAVVGGDNVEHGKPEPDIFLEAARRLSLSPGDVVVIGDRDYDVLPAKRMGSFSVLVVRGAYCPAEKPDAVVSDLRGLLVVLGAHRSLPI
ncbi:MAG: HAD family hydrolase [Conexivisphaera sp.]